MNESRAYKIILSVIQKQISSFTNDLKRNGVETALRNLQNLVMDEELAKAIEYIWKTAGVAQIRKVNRELTERKGFGINKKWIKLIIDYLRENLLVRAVLPILETTKRQIMKVIRQATEEGWGIDKIVRELKDSEITRKRARMIARTELAMARWKGNEVAKEEIPWVTIEKWLAAKDHRTRHSHRLMNGKTIETGEKFEVPVIKKIKKEYVQLGVDLMTGPGDPSASPGNIINCRCTTTMRLKKVNGRLIKK